MRSDRPDSPRRGAERRMVSRFPRLERLESRDLMALVVGPISAIDNSLFSGKIATFATNDILGPPSNFTGTVNWGDGSTNTSPVTFVPDAMNGGFDVISSKTYTTPGKYPVVVTINGSMNTPMTAQGVASVATSPVTLTGISISPTQDVTFVNSAVASFVADPSSSANDFTATINWGVPTTTILGTTITTGPITSATIVQVQPGHFVVQGTYQYAEAGTYTLTVSLKPNDSNTPTNVISSAFVASSPVTTPSPLVPKVTGIPITATTATPPAAVTAGVPFTAPVASFFYGGTSPSAGQFAATVNWGPGLSVTSASILPVSGSPSIFMVSGSFTYPTAGTYPVTVTVVDLATGTSGSDTKQATVVPAPPTPGKATTIIGSGNPITTTAGQFFSGQVATFSSISSTITTNPGSFSATIDWGDGPTPATISYDATNKNFVVFGSNTYSKAGTYPVTVKVLVAVGNQLLTINSSAVVYAFTGGLDPLINTGSPTGIGITNHNQPTLAGTAEPNALVRLFGQKTDGSPTIPLGETVAGSNGLWKMTLLPLADGTYTIVGVGVPTTGSPYPPVLLTTFLVDTVAPRVVGLNYDTSTGKVTVTFRDDRSGLNPASLFNRDNYTLLGPGNTVTPASSVQAGPTVATLPSDPESVVLTFHLNPKNRGGSHRLRIASGGVTDLAGNSLVGGVFGPIPTSKGHPAPSHPARSASHPTAKPNHRH